MKIEKYIIENNKIQNDKTIALISDMHLGNKLNTRHYNNVIDRIDLINPDYITLVGDYFFGFGKYNFMYPESRKLLLYYLDSLKEFAPVIMSLGNHDLSRLHEQELRESFKKLSHNGVYPLDNSNIIIDDFNFFGYFPPRKHFPIDDLTKKKEDIIIDDLKSLNDFQPIEDKINILLSHLPNLVLNDNIQKNIEELKLYDVILSGHAHNGYLRLPVENALIKLSDNLQKIKILENYKEQLEALKYYGFCESIVNEIPFVRKINRGIHDINGSNLVVSKGANITHGHSESYITEINLVRKK